MHNKSDSSKTVIIVLILALILIPATVFAVMYAIDFRSKAEPTENPQEILITNITDSSATISWITPGLKTTGYVKYGVSSNINNVAIDNRDSGENKGLFNIHYVEIVNLDSNTNYSYVLVIGGEEYREDSYVFSTGSIIDTLMTPRPVKGDVSVSENIDEEVLITAYLEKGGISSNVISTLTNDNRYTFDLSNFRNQDLQSYFVDINEAKLIVQAKSGNSGEGSVTTYVIEY